MKTKKGMSIKVAGIFAAIAMVIVMTLSVSVFAESKWNDIDVSILGDACYFVGDMDENGTVSKDDAVYLLYHSVFTEDEAYALPWNANFVGTEEKIDAQDAIFLWDNVENVDFAGLMAHAYGAPVWTWENAETGDLNAIATYQCACGGSSVVGEGVKLDTTTVNATCVKTGSITHTATHEHLGQVYTATMVEELAATGGHSIDQTASVCTDRQCQNEGCTYVEKAEAHVFEHKGHTEATCTVESTDTYTCKNCQYSYTEEGTLAAHTLDDGELVHVSGCTYQMVFSCTADGCNATVKGNTAEMHEGFTATVTKEATCTTDGVKTYTCTAEGCNHSYTEAITKNANAHQWGEGVKEGNITTYACTCSGCTETRTTVDAKNEVAAKVDSDVLAQAGEVEVNNTAIKLDEDVLGNLEGEVEISAGVVPESDKAAITDKVADVLAGKIEDSDELAEQIEMIKDAEIYDFSMAVGNQAVSDLGGKVTISLPYELAEGEDVDCIDVWYIADNGEVTSHKATYSNGFVTFETDHFSYYTVTRLTPAQRCEKYGHTLTTSTVTANCETDGYTLNMCVRCGFEEKVNEVKASGHAFKTETTTSCTAEGKKTVTCENCDYKKTSKLPALGHDWEETESVAATCTDRGYTKSVCKTCSDEKVVEHAQLAHTLETTTVDATCETKGSYKTACTVCGFVTVENEIPALGHNLVDSWTWNETEAGATLTLACDRDSCEFELTKVGTLTVKSETAASCEVEGSITYTAAAAHNGKVYKNTEEKTYVLPALGHDYKEVVTEPTCTTDGYTTHTCTRCNNSYVDNEVEALGHNYEAVVTEATCTTDGYTTYTCDRCDDSYIDDEVAALGHDMSEPVVTKEATCTQVGIMTSSCSRCDHKVETSVAALGHDMGEAVVTKEATCTEDGVKTSSCSRCDHKVETVIPAHGHEFEGGKCKHCGFITTDCTHEMTEFVEEDFSDYGMCYGMFGYNTCECGAYKVLAYYDMRCDFEYNYVMSKDANGYIVYTNEYTCKDCGFHIEEQSSWKIHDGCKGDLCMLFTLTDATGEVVFTYDGYNALDIAHPQVNTVETKELSTYGLCGGTITTTTCVCGENVMYSLDEVCDWESVDEEFSEGEYYTEQCPDCNTKKVISWSEEELGNCQYKVTNYYTYSRDGVKVFEFANAEIQTWHNADRTFELVGDSCDDGYYVIETCKDCGQTSKHFEKPREGEHGYLYSELDVSKYDLCQDIIWIESCPCGEYMWSSLGQNCEFDWYDYSETVTEEGWMLVTEYAECVDCGLVAEYETIYKPTGNPCIEEVSQKVVYSKGGEVIFTKNNNYKSDNHDSVIVDKKLYGTTCNDGVDVTFQCRDCGETYTQYYDWHVDLLLESHDLSEYGICKGTIEVIGCPCEQNVWFNENDTCSWVHLGYDPETNTESYECSKCGVIQKNIRTEEHVDGCIYKENVQIVYVKNGETVLVVDYARNVQRHQFEYQFELDGTVCSDGITISNVCTLCGFESSWYTKPVEGEHWRYQKSYVNLSEFGFCGGFIAESGCPCGAIDETGYNWWNCSWEWLERDEETNTTWYQCPRCKMTRSATEGEPTYEGCYALTPVKHQLCNANREVLFTIERVERYENHNYSYEFVMNEGATKCWEGYTVISTCQTCGYSYSRQEQPPMGSHVTFTLESVDLTDKGFCNLVIRKYRCACGESTGYSWGSMDSCQFMWQGHDPELNTESFKCAGCGGYYIRKMTDTPIDDCHANRVETCTFYSPSGEAVFTYESEFVAETHEDLASYTLNGETCEDGYTVTYTCMYCGRVSNSDMVEYGHMNRLVGYVDLAERGMCAGRISEYSCACGKEHGYNSEFGCNFGYSEYDEETDTYTATCSTCGTTRIEEYVRGEKDESCNRPETRYMTYINSKDEIVYQYEYTNNHPDHDYEYSFEFVDGGTSCEDGYYRTSTCKDCGYVYKEDYLYTQHSSYRVEVIDLSEYGVCEGTIARDKCPCGEYDRWDYYTSCQWTYNNDMNAEICSVCGLVRTHTSSYEVVDKCHALYTYITTFTKDNVVIAQYTTQNVQQTHDTVTDFQLLGTTCEDGYYRIAKCQNCDYIQTYDYVEYGHETWCVEAIDATEVGMCAGDIDHYRCACGEEDYWNIWTQCSWSWVENDTYVCNTCGTVRAITSIEEEIDNCHTKENTTTTYTKDGNVVLSFGQSYMNEHHAYLYDLELKNPEGTCYNGYVATGTCMDCGDSYTIEDSGHYEYLVEYKDLSEDGLCGGFVSEYSCACGEYSEYSIDDEVCKWSYTDTNYTDNVDEYTCDICHAKMIEEYITDEKDEDCRVYYHTSYTYYNAAGEVVYTYTETNYSIDHDYQFDEVRMEDETDCTKGYTEYYSCRDCGHEYSTSSSYHNSYAIEKNYELKEFGGCDNSYIVYRTCYCGEVVNVYTNFYGCDYVYTSNSYVDEDGYSHYVEVLTCDDCGLRYTEDEKYIYDTENCEKTIITEITIAVDATAVDKITYSQTSPYHEYVTTAALADGSKSCEDGVVVTLTCKHCQYTYDTMCYYHYMLDLERIDLTAMGSACGGEAAIQECVCGAKRDLVFENRLCETSRYYDVEPWKGADYDGQETIDGWVYPDRMAYRETCAVTSPKCGFTTRYCRYYVWDAANCYMEEYVEYQLGYDIETDTCQRTITLPTGYGFTYHDYTTTESTAADGTETTVSICNTCQSSHTYSYRSDANGSYSEEEFVNMKNDGNAKYHHYISEHVNYKGYTYPVSYLYTTTYANGNTSHNEYEYIYDWTNFDCTRICRRYDVDGTITEEYKEDCHHITGSWEYIKEPTCTQDGVERYAYKCELCSKITSENVYDVGPYGHSWRYDYDLGIYTCPTCGLQNINGADGSIVFEDLTDEFGQGTNYVIGYYNASQVDFTKYVSVVYEITVDGVVEEMELLLTDIEITELTKEANGVRAMSFNQAEADAAALAALQAEGYTGEYAIRFTFVPVGADGSFDYAITLTDKDVTP